jgi:hypothetical protein
LVMSTNHKPPWYVVFSTPLLQCFLVLLGTGIAQLVQRLATGWTVRGSNSGVGEIFRNRPDRPWGPPTLQYNEHRVLPRGKANEERRWPPTTSGVEVKERVGI